ncbi:3-oxoacyl-[acyl-carrier-protein] reductase [Pseudoflavonifractor phocaeensis]|uniref:3-oxoacyl-[acyl-carrier-protein] reductase n=1 Tax=Pseudoflavonifractor phocaeensis TaxID=1870988 RepID=UPI00195C293F|nr:3-oxoacyl-[acyl-carrier-protein] reductase [Pseudoflavonifractor phocaeensis]MBM6870746.1 3-oxoacyl-[acyl-carrier-protein] reductase [Pseudoflavonifractor phocaeensis]
MNLTGKTALVTGGSRGIGRAICLELARLGANVAVNYAGNAAAAEETVAACQAMGVDAFAIQASVADGEAVTAMFQAVLERFGHLDILVNNAGITKDNLALRIKDADFDAVLDTNLKGAFLCMRAAYRPMMKQRYGRIINMSSIVALRGNAGQANYCASKAGLIGMSKAIAKELASRNVTVNLVAPGFIDTDMTAALPEAAKAAMLQSIPMGRLGQPEDVAKAVAFFASDEAAYVTGQVLCVDGGMAV